jgi:rifampicin phosphotransferase
MRAREGGVDGHQAVKRRTGYVIPFSKCGDDVADEVGGKALGLGFLTAAGFSVPAGFAITVAAYRSAVAIAGLEGAIAEILLRPISDPEMSMAIIELFDTVVMPEDVAAEVTAAYDRIGGGPVAVRSSALAEDTADASFAGQQDTYLWIEGAEEVGRAVVRCWASLYTSQAIGYRRRFHIAPADVAMAVVVQQMVPAVAAGVTMTLEPMTGDRHQIYVESALGLGEGVVKGDVETDSAWVDKATLTVLRSTVGTQTRAHRFDSGAVRLVDLEPGEGDGPCLGEAALRQVAELGRRIEEHAGHPMDIEWALDTDGTVQLLQARPETVWSTRAAPPDNWRDANIMHSQAGQRATWSTTNAAEAIPGIQTPLAISLVAPAGEYGFRSAFAAIGALSHAETATPAQVDDRIIAFFFGQLALNLNVLCSWADRIPGVTGHGMAEQIFAHVPDNYQGHAEYRYYPRAAAKVAVPFLRYPSLVKRDRVTVDKFWRDAQRRLVNADEATSRELLAQGAAALHKSFVLHITLTMGAVQPAFDQLDKLAASVGLSAQTLMSGHGGHEETVVLDDLWECAQDRLSVHEFLLRHGYHGPNEGDIAATVWRENPEPLHHLIASYRAKGEAPNAGAGDRGRRRAAAEAEFLATLPPVKRPIGRALLKLAGRYVPMRGIGKVAFLQGFDVVRAAARRLGSHLVASGAIDDPDDVFFLTIDELETGCPEKARELVAERRALHQHYRTVSLPTFWRGMPEPATVEFNPDADMIEGTGASPGVIEGPVRVVTDPGSATISEGDILVAACTDPSWASLMFLSAGLIADIGGVMSHTAVVARELSIPCVVNTKIAMHVLKNGDRVRMDGSSGLIEIIERG